MKRQRGYIGGGVITHNHSGPTSGGVLLSALTRIPAGDGIAIAKPIGIVHRNFVEVNGGGAGTDLMTYTLPGNSILAVDNAVRVSGWGNITNNANAKNIVFSVGGITYSAGAFTVSQPGIWKIDAVIARRVGNLAINVLFFDSNSATFVTGKTTQINAVNGVNPANDIIIKYVQQAGAASDVTQIGMIVEFFNNAL